MKRRLNGIINDGKRWYQELKKIKSTRKYLEKTEVSKLYKKVSVWLIVIILMPSILFFYLWVTRGNLWFIGIFRSFLDWLGFDSQMVLDNMIEEAAFLGNSVWMMATILSGAVIFYCSLLSNKSYGIPNRKLIAYSVGSWSLPLTVASTIVMVLLMTSAYYTSYFALFYFWAIYSLMPQVIAYIYCIRYCSRKRCFRIILKMEDKQYKWLHRDMLPVIEEPCSQKGDQTGQQQKNEVYENLIFHSQMVMGGEETSEEKLELIQQILLVPFRRYEYRHSEHPGEQQRIYQYVYQNVKRVLNYSDEGLSDFEVNRFYFLIYENIKKLERIYDAEGCTIDKGEPGSVGQRPEMEYQPYWEKLAIYLSAVFHAVLPERKLKNRWQFVLHIVKNLLKSEGEKKLVIGMLLCSIEYLNHKGLLDICQEGNDILKSGEEDLPAEDFAEIKECMDLLNIRQNWSVDNYILEKMYYFLKIWLADTTGADNFWKLFYQIKRAMERKSTKAAIAYFL